MNFCSTPKWKLSTLEPILKHKNDSREVASYRPIAKTCGTGKVLEKMILNRLITYADDKLTKCYAFRRNVGAEDVLAQIADETTSAQCASEKKTIYHDDLRY